MNAEKKSPSKFLIIQYEVIGEPIPDKTYPAYNSGYESKGIQTVLCSEDEFNQCPPDPETTRDIKVLAELDANNPIVKRYNMHDKLIKTLEDCYQVMRSLEGGWDDPKISGVSEAQYNAYHLLLSNIESLKQAEQSK